MAAPRCVYCGGALGVEAVAAASAARQATLAPAVDAGPARSLLVVETEGADPAVLAKALGESAYEAGQRVRRGGCQLWRALTAGEGEREAARLREAGIAAWDLDEAAVRTAAVPRRATRGALSTDGLHLETDAGPAVLVPGQVLLVAKGPIAREYQPEPVHVRRLRLATLDPGFRFHLHCRADPRPCELDPADFDFGPAATSASGLLQLSAWAAALGAPVDEGFRRLPPALAPSAVADPVARALGAPPPGKGRHEGRVVLDNLGQFRFYSAWRAAVERRR